MPCIEQMHIFQSIIKICKETATVDNISRLLTVLPECTFSQVPPVFEFQYNVYLKLITFI